MYDSIVFLGRDLSGDLWLFYACPIFINNYDDEGVYSVQKEHESFYYERLVFPSFPQIAPGELWLLDTATMEFYCVEKH